MSSDATATGFAFRRNDRMLWRSVSALVWEECRVGGAVAALCTVGAWLMLLSLSVQIGRIGEAMWIRGDGLLVFTVTTMPLLLALLLVLNPANSGHLMGGFSQRVLWLPVPVYLAVAVALGMRTLFLAVAVTATIAFTHLVLAGGPPLTLVALFVMLFVAIQTLDWLRAAVSGLSSLLAGAVVVLLLLLVTRYNPFALMGSIAETADWGTLIPAALASLAMSYGISVAAVSATRAGRHIGIPEIWEWPRYLERKGAERLSPFQSPLAAQVWFEWRRCGWTLPVGTLLLTVFFSLAYALGAGEASWADLRTAASFAVFPAVLLSALAHGIRARVLGIRPKPGKPGFDYLLPRSSAEEAMAKCIVSALALVPTVFIVIALHLSSGSGSFFTDLVPYALEKGITSPREVAWSVASRGVLLLLLAWPLMAIGTRGMRWLLFAMIMGVPLASFLNLVGSQMDLAVAAELNVALQVALPSLIVLATIAAFALAWRRRLLGPIAMAACTGVWLLTAWFLHGALPAGIPLRLVALESLAWASLVPLPFALITLDSARKRHGKVVEQAPGAAASAWLRLGPRRWAFVAAMALVMLWMGWPSEPSYKNYLRAEGAPVSRADLNDIYPAVPDDENVALRYMALGDRAADLEDAFVERGEWELQDPDDRWSFRVYGVSDIPLQDALDLEKLEITRAYWAEVTSQITPEMRRFAREGPHQSRYPMDLREGFNVDFAHLSPLRNLARHLSVDTFVASLDGDIARALDNLRAAIALQDSLANEPMLISGLVRMAILGIGLSQVEIMLNFSTLTDADLEVLEHTLRHALPPLHEQRILDGPLRGERMISLLTLTDWMDEGFSESEPVQFALTSPLALIPARLAMPLAAERTALLGAHERMREQAADLAQTSSSTARSFWDDDSLDGSIFHIAPVASIVLPALFRSYFSEWRVRMEIDIARTAIAVERFRREHGRLPEALDELVPEYIEAIPYDVLSKAPGRPVQYIAREDGAFTIYSVGMSGRDDGGRARGDDGEEKADDLTFVVGARRIETQ